MALFQKLQVLILLVAIFYYFFKEADKFDEVETFGFTRSLSKIETIADIKHIVICMYDRDPIHEHACNIIHSTKGTYYDEFFMMQIKVVNFLNKNQVLKFINDVTGIYTLQKITIYISCHGEKNLICGLHTLNSFFTTLFLPIRELTKNLLVIDTSCYSKDHETFYLNTIINDNPYPVEMYLYATCENSCSVDIV